MSDSSVTPVDQARVSVLICGTSRSESVDKALPVLFEHLDLNEGRDFVVLDLREGSEEGGSWLEWVAEGKLPEPPEGSPSTLSGGFEKWPRYSEDYDQQLESFLDGIRDSDRDVIILLGDFDGERRSCLVLCEKVDHVIALVEEGRTRLRDIETVRESLSNVGVPELLTLMFRQRNRIVDWFSQLIE